MGLTNDEIQRLLAQPEKKPRAKRASGIDTSVRDFATWFKLMHKLFDQSTGERMVCQNPDCHDTRPNAGDPKKGTIVAQLEENGPYMCRVCFLEGWLLDPGSNENQLKLVDNNE
jgi:hypothetical protein